MLEIIAEIDETLVDDQFDAFAAAPFQEFLQTLWPYEVSGRIVGIDEQQVRYVLAVVERYDVILVVAETVARHSHGDEGFFREPVRIFFEGREDDAGLAREEGQRAFYEFRGPVARHHVLAVDVEAVAGQQGIDRHPRWILGKERGEAVPHFVDHAGRREIRIHQIAEIQHLGEAPVPAVAPVEAAEHLFVVGEQGFGDVQVGRVIDLIPLCVPYRQGLEIAVVEEGDHPEHLFVILIVTHALAIGVEEGEVCMTRELLGEFVYVDRLVI